jgi:hypothetical protein
VDEKWIRERLAGELDEGDEMERAVKCLMIRQKHLRAVLMKTFPPIKTSFSLNSWTHRFMTLWTPVRAHLKWPTVCIPEVNLCRAVA